ncbi:MAG: DUF3280 domain-containing protein [Fibromonadaceae bacterium]|jgi:hypothetical protein|nr:DUF3280 domain-containing protein [Fibromonadaceae bacterium]
MNKPYALIAMLVLVAMVHSSNIVAVLEIIPNSTNVNLTISEFRHLTDELRTQAREALPRGSYSILTRDNITQLIPAEQAECFAESCAIDIGRAIGAEYVTQGFVGGFDGMLTLTVELYESMSGNLLGSFVTESDGVRGLLSTIRERAPGLFTHIVRESARKTQNIPSVYTILKNDVSKLVHDDGSEEVFKEQTKPVAKQGSTITQIVRNDKRNYYDTTTVSSTRFFLLGARIYNPKNINMFNYSASLGYSGLGINAFMYFDFMQRHKLFKEETLTSDNFIIGNFGLGFIQTKLALSSNMLRSLLEFNEFDVLLGLKFNTALDFKLGEMGLNMNLLYKQWLFSIGPSYYFKDKKEESGLFIEDSYDSGLSLAMNVSYFFKEFNKSEMPVFEIIRRKGTTEQTTEQKTQGTAKRKRYFRPGIELNYPVYRSAIEFFDDSFPYLAAGAGLFFRIGPESIYFTTGAYAKLDVLWKEGIASADFGIFGINILSLPLLDLEWGRFFMEIPLLLSFGSGQIRFTGGALLEYYVNSAIHITINESVPFIGGERFESEVIAQRFEKDIPDGSIYWVFGLDFDIVRYWGIGVKCLIWGGSLGDSEQDAFNLLTRSMGIEPSKFQTRISTYFVF